MTPAPQNARAVLDRSMDEDALLTAIVEAALFCQWQVFHIRRSDKALAMGTPGFPDLCLAKGGRVLFIECKSAVGQLTPGQLAWSLAITKGVRSARFAGETRYDVIRPSDLDAALAELSRG